MDNQEFKIIQNVYNQFNLYYGHIAEKVPADIKTKIIKKFKVKGKNFDLEILLENLKKLKDLIKEKIIHLIYKSLKLKEKKKLYT